MQIANYKRDGGIVAQKLRYPDKKFSFIGDSKACGLFGQHLYEPGRRLVITEGEIDALSVAQALGLRWPVVSVPNGAQGAAKSIKRELEWVNGFDEVVLMFDMDEPGQAAAQEVALLLTPGKAKIAQLPAKDPNELLQRGDAEAITRAIYEAQTKRPDGVVTFGSLKEKALAGLDGHALARPAPHRADLRQAVRRGLHLRRGHRHRQDRLADGGSSLHRAGNRRPRWPVLPEQQPVETAKRMAGKVAGRRFHVPDGSWTQEELEAAFEILDKGQVFIYDHFGSSEWDVIEAKMAHMVVAEGVKHIVLDNLTSFAAGAEDERKMLEDTMAKIAQFAQRHLICIYLVSHLATPEGKPHEEGGRVMLRHFKGSRAIGFWTHFAFGLERNTQAENEAERNCTTFRVLKDRFTGQSNGQVLYYSYDHASGRLLNADAPGEYGDFADESSDVSTSDY